MDATKLSNNIKRMLGGSVLHLEITEEDITAAIDMAFDIIKPYISQRKMITKQAAPVMDLTSDKVLEVLRVFPAVSVYSGGAEILFDFQIYKVGNGADLGVMDMVRNSAAPDLDIGFDFQDGKLYLSGGFLLSTVSIEAVVDVSLLELKDERSIAWVTKYSLALCKEMVGRIRSKFKSSNIPVELDGETLLSEAQSTKDQLESDLSDKDFGPMFVLR